VRQGEERPVGSESVQVGKGRAMETQFRRTADPDDLEIPPEHALGVTGAKCFHPRFLGGESGGVVDRRPPPAVAVRALTFSEDPMEEPEAVAGDRRLDARDVGRIDPDGDDFHDEPS